MNAEEAMNRLTEGNKRYVEGKMTAHDFPARRKELVEGQQPFVTMIACSDSRVCPECIFDTSLGEIFLIETAGNIVGDITLGSIEYGIGHLNTPLLIVLAHSKCGAVTATCQGGEVEGNLGKVIGKIKPAAEKAGNEVIAAIDQNAKDVVQDILARSPVVKKAVDEGKTKIVVMKYHLETGEVKVVE